MALIQIPKGKSVHFGVDKLKNNKFILEEDLTIKVTSNYQSLVPESISSVYTTIAGVIKGLSRDFSGSSINLPVSYQQMGYQQWTGTEPLTIGFKVGIHMEEDAYKDVVVPSQILMSMAVPQLIPNTGGGLAAPGPSLYDVLTKSKNGYQGINLQVGSCYFNQCFIKDADATFSQEVDVDGFPIWASLRMTFLTVFTANTSMISGLFGRIKEPESARTLTSKNGLNTNSNNISNVDLAGQTSNRTDRRPI